MVLVAYIFQKLMDIFMLAKSFKNLLQSQKAYEYETWHETSMNGDLQSLYI